MVLDQDPDNQALTALRYVVEQTISTNKRTVPTLSCEFRVYFPENATEGQYLSD
jgi:hypothetical protein